MDPLSGVASGIALFQLLESIKRLVDFGKDVKDAPANVAGIFNDLELMAAAICRFRSVTKTVHLDDTSEKVLQSCERKVSSLLTTIKQALSRFNSNGFRQRTWQALKITLRKDEIASLQQSINEVILTLLVVQSTITIESTASIDISQQRVLAGIHSIQDQIDQLVLQGESPANIRMRDPHYIAPLQHPDSLFVVPSYDPLSQHPEDTLIPTHTPESPKQFRHATTPRATKLLIKSRQTQTYWARNLTTPPFDIQIITRTYDVRTIRDTESRKTTEMETTYVVRPSSLGRLLGVTRGMKVSASSATGWKYSIQTFREVSSDSLIFEFCRQGNLAAVRSLLERKDASPWDRDPQGRTPLWFAAESLQIEVVRLLLDQGADPHAEDFRTGRGPMSVTVYSKEIDIHPKLAIIDLLQRYSQDSYNDEVYSGISGTVMIAYRPQKDIAMKQSERRHAVTQFLSMILPEFHPKHPGLTYTLETSVLFYYEQDVLRRILSAIDGPIDVPNEESSIVYDAIAKRLLERDPTSMKTIMRRSKRLHTVVTREESSKLKGHIITSVLTPTMLAMYDMATFLAWRRMLKDLGYSMEAFVDMELRGGLLAQVGWDKESLMLLFDSNVQRGLVEHNGTMNFGFPTCERCGDCGTRVGSVMKVDLLWRKRLRDVRLGRFKDNPTAHDLDIQITLGAPVNKQVVDTVEEETTGLPYRVVCSKTCTDGVCVAWGYEDDSEGAENPELLPFPMVVKEEETETIGRGVYDRGDKMELCPTRAMPGAFVD